VLLALPLAQASIDPGAPPSYGADVGLALVLPILICVLLAAWRRTRLWSLLVLLALLSGEVALLDYPVVLNTCADVAQADLPVLAVLVLASLPPALLLLWRRTRRFALAWLGLTVIVVLRYENYWSLVIGSIGYLLLLVALWPRWRMLRGAPLGREPAPVVPSRGVLSVRPWPIDARPRERGFTLVSALVGLGCLVVAFGLAVELIGGTTAALHRADHLAVASDLLESARERALAGGAAGDLSAAAAQALPQGTATITRATTGPGLVRVTATATWREPTGKPGAVTLEWLTAERSR
jgi:hypothetical protein